VDVCLPAAVQATEAEETLAAPRHDLALEGRVLLLETEGAVLEFERDVLAGAGAEVVVPMDVATMKSLLKAQSFGAIIMEGQMSNGCDPIEMHRWISENCPGMEKHLLFTFFSLAEPEVRNFLQERNVPVLVKPFEVADLISQVRGLLQKAQAAGAD